MEETIKSDDNTESSEAEPTPETPTQENENSAETEEAAPSESETSETESDDKSESDETSNPSEKTKKSSKPKELKPITRNHRIKLVLTPVYQLGMTKEKFARSEKLLREIQRRTDAKREKEREKNNLEAYIYEMRDKLDTDEFTEVTNEEQREKFSEGLNKAGDWLYDEGADTASYEYRLKLRELKLMGDKIMLRITEKIDRPKAIAKFKDSLRILKESIELATTRLDVTQEEVDSFLESAEETEKWLDAKIATQDKLLPYEEPTLTSQEVFNKFKILESESKIITRKPLKKKPKFNLKDFNFTGSGGFDDPATPEDTENTEEKTENFEENAENNQETKEETEKPTTTTEQTELPISDEL